MADMHAAMAAAADLDIMPAHLVGALGGVFLDLSLDDQRFLMGPLVVHQSPWNESRPKWMDRQAVQERVGIVLGQRPGFIIGPTEVAAVMYGASLDAPLGRHWQELYLWAATNATARRDKVPVEEQWKRLDMRPLADEDFIGERGQHTQAYRELAWDVRRRVIERGRTQADREQRQEKNVQTCDTTEPEVKVAQLTLF